MAAGRKPKEGIDFISMDCDHIYHKKIRQLIIDCDSHGYWIWQCILAYSGKTNGYYFDISNKDELEFFAVDTCKKDYDLLMRVIDRAIYRGLFNKDIAKEYNVLTHDRMQENFIIATAERRKKGAKVSFYSDFLLTEVIHEKDNIFIIQGNNKKFIGKKAIVPGNNSNNTGNETHSIVEDSKSIVKGELIEANASIVKTEVLPHEKADKELKDQWDKLPKNSVAITDFIATHRPRFIEPYKELFNRWADKHKRNKVQDITDTRKRHFNARIKQKTFDFIAILKAAQEQSFLMEGNWFTFNWIIESPDNYVKVLEGTYHKKESDHAKNSRQTPQSDPSSPTNAMLTMLENEMNKKNNPTT